MATGKTPARRGAAPSRPAGEEGGLPLADALLRAFETNDRINHYLLDGLSDEAWTADPPGGKGRTIAAIVAHMHSVRVMWLKAARVGTLPEQLDRHTVTRAAAAGALVKSRAALTALLAESLRSDGRIKGFRPDVAGFFAYLVAHDAHHRGQITMLARQVGHPISQKTMFGMWEWNSRGAPEADAAGADATGADPAGA
jgi:uncharacterized damage-inducible protein DinB